MSEHTYNMYGRRTYEETPKFYVSDLRPWPKSVRIIKGHSVESMEYVPATPKRGTCHDAGTFKSWGLFTCSNCSIVIPLNAVKDAPEIGKSVPLKFCPNCGRRMEEDY